MIDSGESCYFCLSGILICWTLNFIILLESISDSPSINFKMLTLFRLSTMNAISIAPSNACKAVEFQEDVLIARSVKPDWRLG